MFLVLALIMLGATNAAGQKIYRAELDKSMFKAWDGCGADANEVADPQPIDVTDEKPEGTKFSCDYNLYKEIGDWTGIYGSSAAYYLWYADLTGTKKMYFKGTPGKKFYVQFNRQAPEEGGDTHGGSMEQQELTIGEDGTVTYDIPETMTYVHLNCIKTKGGSGTGSLTGIEIEGTVKPVTGILSMINNGDAEGDDRSSFPVSYDGPNNGDTAPDLPEIVEGGVDGSKCFKVVSFPDPTQTWHTQFYIKADEIMPRGTKWKLVMSIKADHASKITTSAQGKPRQWKGGFIDAFQVTDEWKEYTWSGEIGVDDFQSIAFDLNNGDEDGVAGNGGCAFFFDNIQFGVDLGGTNPMSDIALSYGADVVRVNLNNSTNMKDLVDANGVAMTVWDEDGNAVKTKTLVFDNSCASVTWNGKTCSLFSVEGRTDGNLYVFLLDTDGNGGAEFDAEDADVKVAFTNPADEKYHLTFTSGKYTGEAVPDFSGLSCDYDADLGLGQYFSYLYGSPELAAADPEDGSFNLPVDLKEFKITFNQTVNTKTVVAKLGNESLTVSPAEGAAKTVTLTRTEEGDLNGLIQLTISEAMNEKDMPLNEPIVLNLSFGPVVVDPNDVAEELVPDSYFEGTASGSIPEGFIVNFNGEERVAPSTYGSGPRMMAYNEGGDFTRALYFREGYVLYGTTEGYDLSMKAGKKYDIQFNTMMWKDNGKYMKFEVIDESDEVRHSEIIENEKNINGTTGVVVSDSKKVLVSFTPETDGNYKLKWTASDANGNQAYSEVMLAKVMVNYTPNVPGLAELTKVNAALEDAKKALNANESERYAGTAYDALASKIREYEGVNFTSPSGCQKAADELTAAAKAMTDHHNACDSYDKLPPQAQQLVDDNTTKKFARLAEYAELKATAAKYIVSQEEVTDFEGEELVTKTVYEFKVLTDDTELAAAIKELQAAIDLGNALFTEGASEPENANGGKGTGIAVLFERTRLGIEGLIALGVDENDAMLVDARGSLTDSEEVVDALMKRTTMELYGKLKDGDGIFKETVTDPVTEETSEEAKEYDMTVFVKNPNVYKQLPNMNYDSDNVPGWYTPDGFGKPGLTVGWGAPKNLKNVAEDCMLQTWGSAYRAEQKLEKLPAGVYSVVFAFGERGTESDNAESFVYATTSQTTEGEFAAQAQPKVIGQAFPFASGGNATRLDGIEVKDGILTIGVNAGQGSHTFFNEVRVILTGAATGFDYKAAYAEAAAGIETVTVADKTYNRAIYNLSGQRVNSSFKGLVIKNGKKYVVK